MRYLQCLEQGLAVEAISFAKTEFPRFYAKHAGEVRSCVCMRRKWNRSRSRSRSQSRSRLSEQ